MKYILRIAPVIALLFITLSVYGGPKYIIGLSVVHIDFKSSVLPDGRIYNLTPSKDTVWPGDTIAVEAGIRNYYLRLRNLRGTPEAPVTVINYKGQVFITNLRTGGAMSLKNCRDIRLSGSGSPLYEYGFLLDSTAWGNSSLCLDELTSDVEVHHFEIRRSGFAGIVAKTDPGCDPAAYRGNFVMQHLNFHHNYIHHTTGEGFYIGFCNYGPVVKTCNGYIDTVYAHEIRHLRVHDNIIDYTGLDGMQIGCAVEDVMVYNNRITRSGAQDNVYSKHYGMEGIFVGGGSTGSYFNNYIADGYGSGIFVFGTGNVKVFNNVIVRPGKASHFDFYDHFTYGIFHADRFTVPGAAFYFINNTIVSPRTNGIKIASTESRNVRLYNNIVLDPGSKHKYGTYSNNWMKSCFYLVPGCSVIQEANYFDTTYYASYDGKEGQNDPYFVDAAHGDFRLRDSTALVDKGIAADTVCGFNFDADSLLRPSGITWDIGAYELQREIITEPATGEWGATGAEDFGFEPALCKAFAKNGLIVISGAGAGNTTLAWNLYQLNGKRVAGGSETLPGREVTLRTGRLTDGLYLLLMNMNDVTLRQKVLVVNL